MNTSQKIVVLDALTLGDPHVFDRFADFGELRVFHTTTQEQRLMHIADATIIITNKVLIDASIMNACPQLRLVCLTATGMNNVDLPYASEKGILVKNVAGYSTESVAQHTFAMLLSLMHHTQYYSQYVQNKLYSQQALFTHIASGYWELQGKVWGIIGLGTIGKRVAHIASAFGCKVVYYSTSGANNSSTVYARKELVELLETSDVVSIHAPLNEQTMGLLSYEQFARMKPSSYIVNVGRGGIIDEPALAQALHTNTIAGACLDVMKQEPLSGDSPLLDSALHEKLLITPHIAWISQEALSTLMQSVYNHVAEFVAK